jgi:hypothetical protein
MQAKLLIACALLSHYYSSNGVGGMVGVVCCSCSYSLPVAPVALALIASVVASVVVFIEVEGEAGPSSIAVVIGGMGIPASHSHNLMVAV